MKSIRRTLILWLLAGLGVVWGLAGTGLFLYVRDAEYERFDLKLRRTAQLVGTRQFSDSMRAQNGQGKRDAEREKRQPRSPGGGRSRWFAAFSDPDSGVYFQVWRKDGTVVTRSENLGDRVLSRPTDSASPEGVIWNTTLMGTEPVRALSIRYEKPPRLFRARDGKKRRTEKRAPVDVVVAIDRSEVAETLAALIAGIVGTGLAAGAASLGLVYLALRRGLVPLSEFGDVLGGIDEHSLDVRFSTVDWPRELTPVAEKCDALLSRLQEGFDRERRFSADLAHELRTPIAELRTLSDVALRWPDDREASDGAHREAVAIAAQMEAIVDGMLTLARHEGGQLPLREESVDLVALAQECWKLCENTASERGVTIEWICAEASPLNADSRLLRTVVGNLLSNAVSYGQEKGGVRVSIPGKEGACLTVENPTEGIEQADVDRMFDRLWRGDVARAGDGHFGLGLPLARASAEAAGFSLEASLQDGGGSIAFSLVEKA